MVKSMKSLYNFKRCASISRDTYSASRVAKSEAASPHPQPQRCHSEAAEAASAKVSEAAQEAAYTLHPPKTLKTLHVRS